MDPVYMSKLESGFLEELGELRKLALAGVGPPPPLQIGSLPEPKTNSWGMREGEGVLGKLKRSYTEGTHAQGPARNTSGGRTMGNLELGMRNVFKTRIGKAIGIGGAVLGAGAIAHKVLSKPSQPQPPQQG